MFGVERIPIEDFARPEQFSRITLSDDGRRLAYIAVHRGIDTLYFAETEGLKNGVGLDLGTVNSRTEKREAAAYTWLGNTRVLVGVGVWPYGLQGFGACNADGTKWMPLTAGVVKDQRGQSNHLNAYVAIHSFDDDVNVLVLDRKTAVGTDDVLFPDVVRLNTQTGSYVRVVTNPGDVTAWWTDQFGEVRLGQRRTLERKELLWRHDSTAPWVPLAEKIAGLASSAVPIGFEASGNAFYYFAQNATGFSALYRCDLAESKVSEPLLELPGNDLQFAHSSHYTGPIWSKARKALVGFKYEDAGPHVVYFDRQYQALMAGVDKALPGFANVPVSMSKDEKTLLIYSYSDTEPGTYFLYDVEKQSMQQLARERPWIKAGQMAEMHPIVFNARDGLKLHGYLTIPVGAKPSNLPLVVLPHGGPWVRDIWAFNPLIQMLANRGYAVLQVNYRGSAGYGRDFSEKGRKEVGGAIQTDIEDATRWAIGRKIADPKRIAIMGASYGGYSTLYALGKTPELYRCGIAVSAVTDWMRIYRGMGDESAKFARKYWCEEIGDPEVDNARLNEISPVNFAASITAPLLIVHGEADTVVPFKQAKLMVAALRKAGHPPETLFIADENHHIKSEESRIAEYKAIEAFLEKHLGSAAAVPVVSPQAK